MMDGSVTVESTVGRGSTFTLLLPLQKLGDLPALASNPEPEASVALYDAGEFPALRVLAAEDNPVNQQVLQTLLGQLGLEVTIVCDGAQAVEASRVGDFDIILMDVQMPVMDGVAASRAIRAREAELGKWTPIVALTANAMTHHLSEYRAAGMDGFSSKPIQLTALIAEIERVLSVQDPAYSDAAENAVIGV